MDRNAEQIEVRLIPPGKALHTQAMHLALSSDLPKPGDSPAEPVANLLSSAAAGAVSIDLLIGAFHGDRLISACLAVVSPGAAAMVLLPSDFGESGRYEATIATLRDLLARCQRQSIALLEALTDPGVTKQSRVLENAGFRYLTELIYLRRRRESSRGVPVSEDDLTWIQYLPEREALFAKTLERTYVQSKDCPELTGIRPTIEVLRGHRSTERFDPAMWWVVQRGGESVGILMLNRLASGSAIEVEYVGVVPEVRGLGISDALMNRAVIAARNANVECMALAVDARNSPARRWYDRWGFEQIGSKDAWIASTPSLVKSAQP